MDVMTLSPPFHPGELLFHLEMNWNSNAHLETGNPKGEESRGSEVEHRDCMHKASNPISDIAKGLMLQELDKPLLCVEGHRQC